MYSADEEVPVIQTVSSCLTSHHDECSGYYRDQSGNFFVRCACSCHENGGQMIIELQRPGAGAQNHLPGRRCRRTRTQDHSNRQCIL